VKYLDIKKTRYVRQWNIWISEYLQMNMSATLCNTLHHAETHCNTHLCAIQRDTSTSEYLNLNISATHCNTLQHIETHCNTLQHTATHCNTLQDAALCNPTRYFDVRVSELEKLQALLTLAQHITNSHEHLSRTHISTCHKYLNMSLVKYWCVSSGDPKVSARDFAQIFVTCWWSNINSLRIYIGVSRTHISTRHEPLHLNIHKALLTSLSKPRATSHELTLALNKLTQQYITSDLLMYLWHVDVWGCEGF